MTYGKDSFGFWFANNILQLFRKDIEFVDDERFDLRIVILKSVGHVKIDE